jgi:hypothetical protein
MKKNGLANLGIKIGHTFQALFSKRILPFLPEKAESFATKGFTIYSGESDKRAIQPFPLL